MTNLLEVKNVSLRHGHKPVINDVSFNANAGEFIALLGSNGAGKTTLMDIVAGLRKPDAGEVVLEGRGLDEWPRNALSQRVAHMPQAVRPDLGYSAEQVVLMGRYPHRESWFDSPEDHALAQAAMERTQSWEFRNRRVHTLSGGERQRVLLAACLVQHADLFLFDEPSIYLDIDQQLRCFALLRDEAASGKACIAVTHDINLALSYCSRLLILSGQRLVFDISVEEARRSQEWLQVFSRQLELGTTPQGRPWVWYQ